MSKEKVIRELEFKDIEWLKKSEALGFDILDWYIKTKEVTLQNLDKAFNTWKQDYSENRAPDDIVADGLGVLFGNYILKHKKACWAIVTDSFGTNLTIMASNGVEAYPISSVWKRIDPDNEEISFFEPIYTLVIDEEFPTNL